MSFSISAPLFDFFAHSAKCPYLLVIFFLDTLLNVWYKLWSFFAISLRVCRWQAKGRVEWRSPLNVSAKFVARNDIEKWQEHSCDLQVTLC